MRLKVTPADFVVQEAADLRIRKQPAPYRVYMLEKTDWNTVDALVRIAKEKRVSYQRINYGGKKDRHAQTFQYVTAQSPVDLSCEAKGYRMKLLGYSNDPMGPSHILSNRFTITVRDLKPNEAARMLAGIERVKTQGVPNYFDDQRFGMLDKERGFVAERMLQGRWNDALQLALTTIHPEEHRDAKERKRFFQEHWGDWDACQSAAQTAFEQRSFDLLKVQPIAFREALATVHQETAAMWVSGYQSFLWNEIMRRLLERRGWAGTVHPGVAGPYVFQTADARLEGLIIPLPGAGMRFPDRETGILLEEILAEHRLRPAALEAPLLANLGFKASPRPALVLPQSIWSEGPEPDDRYADRQKVLLRFTLPRGSYATMIVKWMSASVTG